MLARLSLCPEHRTNLLTAITGIPVIKNVLESKQFILGFRCINIVIHGNVANIVVREHHFDQLTSFEIITSQAAQILCNNRSDLAVLNV